MVLRRTESSDPAASAVAMCRILAASSAAARTSWACSAARLVRSWHVAVISSVEALISSVDAEISVAIAAASSAAVRIAPTSRRRATTIVWTEERRSPTSAASVRCVTTVTERSPPATRLAIAPAALTGSVMRWLRRWRNSRSRDTVAPNNRSAHRKMLARVLRAAA